MAGRMMDSQQSAGTTATASNATAALNVSAKAPSGNQQVVRMEFGGLNWSPLFVSSTQARDETNDESIRLTNRRSVEVQTLAQNNLNQAEGVESQDFSSLVEPAKWTVISTGVVIWAVRLGHIITTFASTASAWVYFDPLTVIQSIKEKSSSDDHVTEAMFDASQKKKSQD